MKWKSIKNEAPDKDSFIVITVKGDYNVRIIGSRFWIWDGGVREDEDWWWVYHSEFPWPEGK